MVVMVWLDQNPRVDPHRERTSGAGAAHPGDQFVEEPAGAALGVGLPFAHPGVSHLTGRKCRCGSRRSA